ncbi:hypothetical protein [Streptomyces sp. NPDC058335]|uniref:hypothetical protein n=1 Tax=Streptomyces sp. NPDC058335 TaxID=3346451 RepID=UPI003649DA9E
MSEAGAVALFGGGVGVGAEVEFVAVLVDEGDVHGRARGVGRDLRRHVPAGGLVQLLSCPARVSGGQLVPVLGEVAPL